MTDHDTVATIVEKLAEEAGVACLMSIPGIYECLSEHYANDVYDILQEDEEEEEDEEETEWVHQCPDDDYEPCTPDCPYPMEDDDE